MSEGKVEFMSVVGLSWKVKFRSVLGFTWKVSSAPEGPVVRSVSQRTIKGEVLRTEGQMDLVVKRSVES